MTGTGHRRVAAFAAGLVLLLAPAAFPLDTNRVRFVLGAGGTANGTLYSREDMVSVVPGGQGTLPSLQLPGAGRVGVDALMMDGAYIVFSPDVTFTATSGAVYADEDLVLCNPASGTYSLFIDGSGLGIPEEADLDAVAYDASIPGFLFSLDIDCTVAAVGAVTDSDVLLWRPGIGVFLQWEGWGDMGIPDNADLDALYKDGLALMYSIDCTAVVNTFTGRDEDVFIFATWIPETIGVIPFPGIEYSSGLGSLDDAVDTDGDMLTDFEESSGLDETSTHTPGSSNPLSPGGHVTYVAMADSDGDLFSDGEEAWAGSDPNNSNDFLRVLAIEQTGNTQVVTWASAAGRTYDLCAATNISAFNLLIANDVSAAGASTSITNVPTSTQYFYRAILQP